MYYRAPDWMLDLEGNFPEELKERGVSIIVNGLIIETLPISGDFMSYGNKMFGQHKNVCLDFYWPSYKCANRVSAP